jgi:hypothetical protein
VLFVDGLLADGLLGGHLLRALCDLACRAARILGRTVRSRHVQPEHRRQVIHVQ